MIAVVLVRYWCMCKLGAAAEFRLVHAHAPSALSVGRLRLHFELLQRVNIFCPRGSGTEPLTIKTNRPSHQPARHNPEPTADPTPSERSQAPPLEAFSQVKMLPGFMVSIRSSINDLSPSRRCAAPRLGQGGARRDFGCTHRGCGNCLSKIQDVGFSVFDCSYLSWRL